MAQITVNAEMQNLGEHWVRQLKSDNIREFWPRKLQKMGLPNEIVKLHREGRSTFTNKKQLHRISKDPEKPLEENPRRRSGRDSTGSSSVILPSHCIFCKKDKYRSKSKQERSYRAVPSLEQMI